MVRRGLGTLMRLCCATSAALLLLLAPTIVNAQPGSITVTITSPNAQTRFGQELLVNASVTSTNQLATVVASVGGVTANMSFTGLWQGALQTAGLPHGPVTLTVTATDVFGNTGQAQRPLFHDNPPTIEYLSPEWNALARPDVRVHARCTDDAGACQLRCVECGGAAVVGEIDTVVSLEHLEGRQINLTIAATDNASQVSTAWRPVWVESSRRLQGPVTFPGPILDIDDTRALILHEFSPRTAQIIDRSTGQTTVIFTEGARTIERGFLTPGGALVVSAASGSPMRLHEWRNATLTDLDDLSSPESVAVAGSWAIYTVYSTGGGFPLVRRDLTLGTNVTISTTALNNGNDVTTAGVVVYADPLAGSFPFHLYRFANGSSTPLTAGSSGSETFPSTDGVLTAYSFFEGFNTTGIRLITNQGIETLATDISGGRINYRVVNGWTAFLKPGAGGSKQVWTRAPDGTLRQITSIGGQALIDALTPDGDVVYRVITSEGQRRFLARADNSPIVEIGSGLGRPVQLDGDRWYVLVGPHLLGFSTLAERTFTEGAASPFFKHDLAILNPTASPAEYFITTYRDDGDITDEAVTLGANSRYTVRTGGGMTTPRSFSTIVGYSADQPAVVERTMTWDETGYGGHSASPVDRARLKWLFAEGAQGYFDTYFLLLHTGAAAQTARLTFFVEGGASVQRTVTMSPHARLTLYAGAIPELVNRSFSTLIETSVPIVAERAMYFGPAWAGGHASAGVADPARHWFHAEGATGPVFDTYILLANPNANPTNAQVTYLTDGGVTVNQSVSLLPFSRLTIAPKFVDPQLAVAAFATTVTSDLPIVSERAMYWSTTGGPWIEAHNSFGLTATATKWGTSDGRVGGERVYQTYVLVANPSTTETANLTVTFIRAGGQLTTRTLTLGPSRRLNIFCNDIPELANSEFGVVVESTNSVPIAVERATYWNAGGVTWGGGTNVTATALP